MTHTPPSIGDETATDMPTDPGFIGSTVLLPSSFSTGSYGWKGTKRVVIELQDEEDGKEKEKVHVMLTCVLSVSLLSMS
jgi:hypothetical protein